MPEQGLDVFSVRDLRLRSSELVRDAQSGRISVITKRGRPAALALFEQRLVTLERAAKLAGMTLDGFLDLLAQTSTVAVDYPPEELEDELSVVI